jgi:acetyl-CoA synthetase
LACTRLGIPYTVVFAGFSPNAVALRMRDCNSKFIITCDASVRGGKIIPLKQNIDSVRGLYETEIQALIVRRQKTEITWDHKLDIDYYEVSRGMPKQAEIADTLSNDDLYVLYTSGSAGKPKGVLQGTGGFLLFSSMTSKYFFDLDEDSIFWCSGDIGWMGGHAYSLYAPLCNGVTTLIFEGIPTYPSVSIFWDIIDKHKVTSFNTAPTALRAMMRHSEESLKSNSRESLRLLGVFGEVLNKDAWRWYFNEVGCKRCPIVNMWGQTELGGVPTAPLCNLEEMRSYGHIGRPFFGCNLVIMDDQGNPITSPEEPGALFIKNSMPGMLKGIYGEENGMHELYYSKVEGLYYTGDEAYEDYDGLIWITGRMDDVLNVSGHRISPIEIEEVISKNEIVAEVSVVGYPHPIKGDGIYAFVILKRNLTAEQIASAPDTINQCVRAMISPITKPDIIMFVDDLPKTRSGKIMRRILRKIAAHDIEDFEDITAISNPECIFAIIKKAIV